MDIELMQDGYIRNPLRDCSNTMTIHFPDDRGRPLRMAYPEDDFELRGFNPWIPEYDPHSTEYEYIMDGRLCSIGLPYYLTKEELQAAIEQIEPLSYRRHTIRAELELEPGDLELLIG